MIWGVARSSSPPPERAYRSPVNLQVPANMRNDSAFGQGARLGSAQALNSLLRSPAGPSAPGGGVGHHVDIHIAILSPSNALPANEPSASSLTQAVSNLTNTLAARTQELAQRTAAISDLSNALSQALENRIAAVNPDPSATGSMAENDSNNDNEEQSSGENPMDDSLGDLLPQQVDESRETLMPLAEDQGDASSFWNVSNTSISTGNPSIPEHIPRPPEQQIVEDSLHPGTSVLAENTADDIVASSPTAEPPSAPAQPQPQRSDQPQPSPSHSILHRLRRSFAFRP